MSSSKVPHILFHVFFWMFNGSLLLPIYFGLVLFWGLAIVNDIAAGEIPLNFWLPFVGLIAVPTACTLAEIVPKTRRSLPPFLFFYGVEAPLIAFCALRFFWLRDLTAANLLILCTSLVGAIAFTHWLLQGRTAKLDERGDLPNFSGLIAGTEANWWHLGGQTLMLMLALYLVAIAAFYVPPVVVSIVMYVIPAILYSVVVAPLAILLIGLASIPFGMTIAYGQAWRQSAVSLAARHGKTWVAAFTVAIVAVWLGIFVTVQQQPQIKAFALLDRPADQPQRQELLKQSGLIRQGLLNAYLAAYRYPYIESTSIRDLYLYSLSQPESVGQALQNLYNFVMSPFTYQGTRADADKAAALYAQFFDAPMLRAEQAAIKKAIQSTFDRDQAKAGLLDVGEQRVWLAEQKVTVTPQGDWADVEISEVYDNQTFNQEEILYYFSLPESAAITGIWLGETGDRAQAFPYAIAPRGAAQQVYNEEVERRVDPALLEQVGPRQYRLRAFPIPPIKEGKLHLWLTYKVMQQEGSWPLPQLAERRNLYWTNQTQRQINGKSVAAKDQWLPAAISAEAAAPTAHQIDLPWGAHVLALPFEPEHDTVLQGKRFALVLDGSYSMNAHRQEVTQTFDWLQNKLLKQNQADLYLTSMTPASPQRIDNLQGWTPDKAVFYGTLQPRQMLQQFQQLKGNAAYDAIVLITDSGSYELTEDSAALSMPAPLWLVHLGGLQSAYDDATLQAIQASGGNVATTVQEVMQRIGTQPSQGQGTSFLNLVDGYAWYLRQEPTADAPVKGFEAIAARQWVTHLSHYVKPDQLTELDTIHAITKEYGIVTPYSSMVVLVNDAQRQRLNQLEQSADRFNREVEDQQLPQPSGEISSVPEPAEWLLLLVAAIALSYLYWRQQQAQSIG